MKNPPDAPAKVSRPHGNRPVPRQRLFERLDGMRQVAIVWVTGAPGAGKTTLASSYLAQQGGVDLWYQFDADDGDPATFFHYLGLAVRHAATRADPTLPTFTPEYLPGLMSFTRRYAAAIADAIEMPAVLVLDNYEHVPLDSPLHGVIHELAVSLPHRINMLVLSRTDPPPVFARLRMHEGLALLDGRELRLTPEEGRSLAAARALPAACMPDPRHVDRLVAEADGWLAGFTLLLTEGGSPREPSLRAQNQQLLFDYFATELFERFEGTLQDALLRTALLPTMTLAHAEQMAGDAAVGLVLAGLHRQNCFVVGRGRSDSDDAGAAADGAHVVYEYHALFRAFLLSRAARRWPAPTWRALQCRAASLLDKAGQADVAAGLYREARATDELASLAQREASSLIAAGRHRTLMQWLDELPDTAFEAWPWLLHWRAVVQLPFDAAAARVDFRRAYVGFQRDDDAVGLYATWAGAVQSFFFEWRNFTHADDWISEFEHLRSSHPEFPSRAVELRTYSAMGTLLHRAPQHPLLPEWAERAPALFDRADRDLSVMIGGYLIIWFLWRGETAKARGVVERLGTWPDAGSPIVHILWSCALALYHSVQGETRLCRSAVEEGLAVARRSGLHGFDFLLTAQMARCCLVAGDAAEAETWMVAMGGSMGSHTQVTGAFYCHLHCNAAAQRGDWIQALEFAREGARMAQESGMPILVAHCHVDLARALLGSGDTDEWAGHIGEAEAIARRAGWRVVDYLCLEARAVAAFQAGAHRPGLDRLAEALALSRAMDGATWLMAGPAASARLYDRALAAGIEVDHVQRQIRRYRLSPPDPATAAEAWPWPIQVYTLGRFDLLCDGVPLRANGKVQAKPLELLKCLLAGGSLVVSQDRVADALWPESEGDAADQALRTTLHRLRKLLRHEEAVRLEARQLHLDPRCLWADCLAFDRAAHHPGLADRGSLLLGLNRYRGLFLPGESAPWAVAYRDRLRAQYLRMAERLGLLLEQEGDDLAAADCYVRAIEVEPLAEIFYRRLMCTYARLERRPEALLVYQRCRQALLSRLGVSPTAETQALHRTLTAAT
jgi:ATP/maltotriose-dependent transcriptional regulator MalT/DNA-binding SARP family transcriptional activator